MNNLLLIGSVVMWAPVKKEQNRMYMSGNKNLAVEIRNKTVDLKETKDLYGRLMVLSRSNTDVNQRIQLVILNSQ